MLTNLKDKPFFVKKIRTRQDYTTISYTNIAHLDHYYRDDRWISLFFSAAHLMGRACARVESSLPAVRIGTTMVNTYIGNVQQPPSGTVFDHGDNAWMLVRLPLSMIDLIVSEPIDIDRVGVFDDTWTRFLLRWFDRSKESNTHAISILHLHGRSSASVASACFAFVQ